MDGLLTFALIFLLIIFLLRWLAPIIFRLFIRRMTRFNMRDYQSKKQNVAYKKGETTIISHGEERTEVPKDFGDYTDYEEIKE
jgi:uncharacterized protein HemY